MTREPTEIEVEVIEIDGVTPTAPDEHREKPAQQPNDWSDWRGWQSRVQRLDSRWWPLWVVLGIVVVALMVTVGLVLGVVFLLVRLTMKVIRAIFE